ncbi:hypothetical protein BWQ96_00527 [Gracilariopsis chorda]|uniref:Uncharacterized protein n=1 Tax=Gracilariopsis chorda TaxID=448386 RepID=A0A2V3J5H4_9FLOR|nr:hypothetical protein BWQ96_00527 [Gracilariopsis chorda]|eukprot:PXF49649.1 hypothetical protein BWQ96_00527 [Gracilariopsis chorda]
MGPGHSTTSAARRLSVAAFCVRNETGRTMQMWLPYDSKRRSLRGNGGEIEVDTPSEEVLWTAMGATGTSSTDPAINRQLSMSCILALRGYEALTLSAEQTGSRLVRLIPDTTDNSNSGPGSLPAMMTLVWAVTMRDGVPCGCICSALRLVNRTRRLLEVNVGGIRKSMSVGNEMKVTPIQNFDSTIDCHGRIKPGEAWAVPIHSIFKVIRIRPHLLHASEMDKSNATGRLDDHLLTNSARCYEFLWSDPISNLSSLYETADDLRCNDKRNEMSGDGSTTTALRAPLLTCRGADSRKVFCLSVLPIVDLATITRSQMKDWISGSIDVQLCTPLVIENLLPRVVVVKLATPGNSQRSSTSKMITSKHMDPLSEAHIYGVWSDHSSLAIALGMDNSLDKKSRSLAKSNPALPSRQTGSFHPNLLTLK